MLCVAAIWCVSKVSFVRTTVAAIEVLSRKFDGSRDARTVKHVVRHASHWPMMHAAQARGCEMVTQDRRSPQVAWGHAFRVRFPATRSGAEAGTWVLHAENMG